MKSTIAQWRESFIQKWQNLPKRDQQALGILAVFLLCCGFGLGGYQLNQMANKQKKQYQQNLNDYFWLRAQASNLSGRSAEEQALPVQVQIEQILMQSGIANPQVVQSSDGEVQLSFVQDSQVQTSQALGRLEQAGWILDRLSIEQDRQSKQLQVEARLVTQ